MKVEPLYYAIEEGGAWNPWTYGPITLPTISDNCHDNPSVSVIELSITSNISITAFKFSDGREWDSVNGWRNQGYKEVQPLELGKTLMDALEIINGERQDQYGNPEDSFALIAEYWSVYLHQRPNLGKSLNAKDVAHLMMLFKLARCSGQQFKRDNYVDICGYSSIVADRLMK